MSAIDPSEQVVKVGGFFAKLGPMQFLQGMLSIVVLAGFGMSAYDANRKSEQLEHMRAATAAENAATARALHEIALSNATQTEVLRQLSERENANTLLWQAQFTRLKADAAEIKSSLPPK